MINWGFKIGLIGLFILIVGILGCKILEKEQNIEYFDFYGKVGGVGIIILVIGVILGIILL